MDMQPTGPAAGEAEGQTTENAAAAAAAEQLAAENAELKDRLLRRMAEFENYRRRIEREKSEISEFAIMETLQRLLPILDDFERALAAQTSDPQYARGIELIMQRLRSELEKLGLETIETEGRKFDPHLHHAVEIRETSEAEDHAILAVLRKGYTFRGKLLRPAMVRVAVAPGPEKQPQA